MQWFRWRKQPDLTHPPLSHPTLASPLQPHRRQTPSFHLVLQVMREARMSIAHKVPPALGCRLAQPRTPSQCSETTSSGRSFPMPLPSPCSEFLPGASHVLLCHPSVPHQPPKKGSVPGSMPAPWHSSVGHRLRHGSTGTGDTAQGSGAFCGAKQSVVSIYFLLTVYCSSEEGVSAFKCSEAPRGLSTEWALACPLAACAGLCRQLLTERMPAPASLGEVKPNPGSETAQAALLMLQELKHEQRVTLR